MAVGCQSFLNAGIVFETFNGYRFAMKGLTTTIAMPLQSAEHTDFFFIGIADITGNKTHGSPQLLRIFLQVTIAQTIHARGWPR